MSHQALYEALTRRFDPPEWALFAEVRTQLGSTTRSADAVAMNLWPSRGMALAGFELKQDRRDWLREKRNPEKAEAMARLCNEWWLVTTEGVIKDPDEIPGPWGWLLLADKAKTLRVKQKPEIRPSPMLDGQPVLLRSLVASLVRRAHTEGQRRPEVNAAQQRGYAEGVKAGRDHTEWHRDKRAMESKVQALERELSTHREAQAEAGLGDYSNWQLTTVARELALVHTIGPERVRRAYANMLREIDVTREHLTRGLEQLEADTTPKADTA